MKSPFKSLLREPLLHFLVIGLLIFGVDKAISSTKSSAHVIVVNQEVRDNLTSLFDKGHGRDPTPEELDYLIDRWIYDEVMYREALALGLDKGDDMFRSRLELKLRSMLIDNAVVDTPGDNELKQWLADHRDRFTAPRRFDFVQIRIEGDDAEAERKARELAQEIGDGPVPEGYDDQARYYKNRTRENIAEVFGEPFAAGLLDPDDHLWHAVHAADGWRIARMEADKPAVEPDFDSIRAQLAADWKKAKLNQLALDAYKEIQSRYEIVREDKQ